MIDHAWRWSKEAPEGRLFHIDDLPNLGPEWVDSPWKIDADPEPVKKPARRRKAAD